MRPPGTAEELERRRRRAVHLLEQGESPTDIGRFLGCSRSSVYRWEEARARPEGLAAKPHPGARPKLDERQLAELEELLKQGALVHGWKTNLWTAKRVVKLVRRHFGVKYHPEGLRLLLKKRLGWTSQKPVRRARERDEAEIARWVREEFPRIKRGRAGAERTSCSSTNRGIC